MRPSGSTTRKSPPCCAPPPSVAGAMGEMDDRLDDVKGLHDAARDAANWAKHVSKLTVSNVPEGAITLNVNGRRLAGPVQGFGKMWQKTYQMSLPATSVAPAELIA